MSQVPATARKTAGRTGVGLALVTAMTAATAAPAMAAPAPAAPATAAPAVAPRPVAARVLPAAPAAATYTVREGDTVWGIARQTGTTAAAIMAANGLGPQAVIHPGQTLKLSGGPASSAPAAPTGASGSTYTVQRGDTVSGIARKAGTSVAAIIAANGLGPQAVIYPGQTLKLSGSSSSAARPAAAPTGASGSTYTVQRGDTVSGIARKAGTSVAAIIAANGLGAQAVIYPGQTLKLSGTSSPAAGASSSSGRVGSTFLGRTYSDSVVGAANSNAAALDARSVPSKAQMQAMVRRTAQQMGVDPALALAHAHLESGFNMRAVSPANAVGVMQVIPSSGEWASDLVGRRLDLLDPQDNVTAGVAIIRQLHRMTSNGDSAIAGYYQGLGSVNRNGMYRDTRNYVANVRSLMNQYR